MHIVYAGTRKAARLLILMTVLACILRVTFVMAFAAGLAETDMQAAAGVSTVSNASANGKIAEIATVSDAEEASAESEKISKDNLAGLAEEIPEDDAADDSADDSEEDSEEDSEQEEWYLEEEPLLDDLSLIASVSNAEFQELSYPPQISVVVPTQMRIVVNSDGSCTAAGGSLENHGESAVLLTAVTFAWQTEDERDADDIFTEWDRKKPCVRLTLGDDLSCMFEQEPAMDIDDGAGMTWNLETDGLILEAGEELELNWEFALNGNSLDRSLDAEEEAAVAIVTYTVRGLETS